MAGVSLALLAGTAGPAAAGPQDWWIYVANDFPSDLAPLLAQGADPNQKTAAGQPAIMQAMRDKAWKVYDLLASNPRTDVNQANAQDETPLMFLAVLGQTDRARKLIARGAQVNRLGWTPLHYAVSTGKLQTAQMLMKQGAIINAPSPDGTTPLMMAARSQSPDTAQMLLAAGADATTRNLAGLSAGDWARSAKDEALGKTLDEAAKRQQAAREASRPPGGGNGANAPDAAPEASAPRPAAPATESGSPRPASRGNVGGVEGVRLGE
jgi:ankyrin repeat protein